MSITRNNNRWLFRQTDTFIPLCTTGSNSRGFYNYTHSHHRCIPILQNYTIFKGIWPTEPWLRRYSCCVHYMMNHRPRSRKLCCAWVTESSKTCCRRKYWAKNTGIVHTTPVLQFIWATDRHTKIDHTLCVVCTVCTVCTCVHCVYCILCTVCCAVGRHTKIDHTQFLLCTVQ